jgi:hypothetical protein
MASDLLASSDTKYQLKMDIEKSLGLLKMKIGKKLDLIFEGINLTTLLSPVNSIQVNGVCR